MFGVGGLIGPFIVYLFEINSFAIIGVFFALTIPIYYILPPPSY
jgi:hypothetical protein